MNWDDLSDKLNPLLLKEARQFFHNRGLLGVMGFLLAAELLMLVIIKLTVMEPGNDYSKIGMISFVLQNVGMGLAIMILCAFQFGKRFESERIDRDLDYSRLSTISPFSIVLGKLCSALLLMLFIHSLCLPFMVIAYFMRGITFALMAGWICSVLPMYVAYTQLALLIGSFGKKGSSVLLVLFFNCFFGFISLFVACNIPGAGIMPIVLTDMYLLVLFGLLFTLTLASVTNARANVMFWPRLYSVLSLIAIPAVNFIVCFVYEYAIKTKNGVFTRYLFGSSLVLDYETLSFGAITALMLILCMTIVIVVFERTEPGVRVMNERPHGAFRRFVYFFLSSGKAGGLALGWILTIAFVGCVYGLNMFAPDKLELDDARICLVCCYVLFNVQIIVILERIWPKVKSGIFLVGVFLIFDFLPFLVVSIMKAGNFAEDIEEILVIATPLLLFDDMVFQSFGWCPMVFAILSALPLIPYVWREFRAFMKIDIENKQEQR